MLLDPARAWQPYRPDDKNPWDIKKVGHLYRRAAFGANYRQLDEGMADGPEKTIAGLLGGGASFEAFNRQMAEMTSSLNRLRAGRSGNGATSSGRSDSCSVPPCTWRLPSSGTNVPR